MGRASRRKRQRHQGVAFDFHRAMVEEEMKAGGPKYMRCIEHLLVKHREEIHAGLRAGKLFGFETLHDDGCPILMGGICMCNPVVNLVEREAGATSRRPSTFEEFLQGWLLSDNGSLLKGDLDDIGSGQFDTWLDLPPDEDLDVDLLRRFDRFACDQGHDRFLRRLSLLDLPSASPARDEVLAEIKRKGFNAVLVVRMADDIRLKFFRRARRVERSATGGS